jgi:hypothetical protein
MGVIVDFEIYYGYASPIRGTKALTAGIAQRRRWTS